MWRGGAEGIHRKLSQHSLQQGVFLPSTVMYSSSLILSLLNILEDELEILCFGNVIWNNGNGEASVCFRITLNS